jgi:hypothetical protein
MDYLPPRPDQPYAWDDERLSAYLDGELSAPEQAQLEARLVVDPELRQLVDELRAVRQQLEILPEYRLKPTFADQVLRRAEQEMLLAPLGRESAELVVSAAAPPAPALPAATLPAEPPMTVAVSPARVSGRRWRRGAIWTAIAAAAALLLLVTNRPNSPPQDHLARHDLPELGVTKSTGQAPATPAATPEHSDQALPDSNALAANAGKRERDFKSGEREAPTVPPGQAAPAKTTVVGKAGASSGAPAPLVVPSGAAVPEPKSKSEPNSKPELDAAPNKEREMNQLARTTGGDKPNAAAANNAGPLSDLGQNASGPGNARLKNQNPGARKGTQEKQAATRDRLTPELQALLASDEFARLATAGQSATTGEDQVLVVSITPRAALRGEALFESLLASNSIELADKPLQATTEKQRQRSIAHAKDRAAEPLAKSTLQDEQTAGAKALKAAEASEAGNSELLKNELAKNEPALRKEAASPPASDTNALAKHAAPANEVYYLEAEANQVDELLRQLRSSSAQFSQLNITPRAFNESKFNNGTLKESGEQSLANQAAAAGSPAPVTFSDSAREPERSPAGQPQFGKQPLGDQKQHAQGATPLPPAAPSTFAAPAAPPGAALPPTPAPPAPAAEPFAAPAATAPNELSAAAAPAALPTTDPKAADGAAVFSDLHRANGLGSMGTTQRRAMQADKSPSPAAGERAIAYRLRGVESLLPAQDLESAMAATAGNRQDGGGGGAGGSFGAASAMPGKLERNKPNADSDGKHGNLAKGLEPAKPADARLQLQAEGVERKLDSSPAATLPMTPAPALASQEQPQPPLPNEPQQRALERSNAPAAANENSLAEQAALAGALESAAQPSDSVRAESAKKSAPTTPAKRVRVLFVIEHDTAE